MELLQVTSSSEPIVFTCGDDDLDDFEDDDDFDFDDEDEGLDDFDDYN